MDSTGTSSSRDLVHVVGSTHPLVNQLEQLHVPAGLTIAETLELALARASLDWPRDQMVASVGNVRVPMECWARVRPKAGTVVVFRPVLRDDKFLRSALGFAVAIAALFVVPFLTPMIGAIGASLVGAAITIGGSLLINALIPVRPPQIDSGRAGKSLPMLGGAQNEARQWEVVPVVLGRHRLSPFYAARPYSFWAGNKQYMNLLFAVGYGRLQLTQLKIGETPLASFEDLDYEVREGATGDAPTSLFPVIPSETTLSVTLSSADSWVTRRTDTDANQISIDLLAPAGIFIYNSKTGAYDNRPVTVQVRYRRVGDAGAWTNRPNIVFTRHRDTVRLGDRWAVDGGQWDVGVMKATADYAGAEQVADTIQWITLRSFKHGHPITFPKPLAVVAVRMRATNQLNGLVNTFNCVAESYVNAFNGTAWVAGQLSRNNADLYRHVLQGPANARPRTDAQVDFDSIEDWWQDCVDNDYSYNAVQANRRTVREVLADIAAAGRATVALRSGKWGVSFPRRSDTTSWHFTPRNSTSFRTEHVYRQIPHGLRIRFIDQDHGWRERERIVYADGYNKDNATLFEQIELPGVTRSQNVWRHGRFQLAQAILRPESHTMGSDVESLRLERGDRVAVSNDLLLVGTGYGRVKAVDAGAQTVELDSVVIMETTAAGYAVRFTLSDGTLLDRVVFNTANETSTLQLDPDLSTDMPEVGNLFSFGETEHVTRDYRVLEVRPGGDLSAQFTLVDDAPEIDDADTGTIPDYDPGITDPPDPYTLTPQSLTVSERLVGNGITTKSVIQLTVQIPRVGTVRAFEFQAKDVDAEGDWALFAVVAAPHTVAESSDLEPGSWQFRVRSLFADDNETRSTDSSSWVESDVISVLGLLAPPGDVVNLQVTTLGDSTRLTWSAVGNPLLAFYRVKYSSVTDGSATWGASLLLSEPVTNYVTVPARPGTYSVKAVTYKQVESIVAAFAVSSVEAGTAPNVVVTIDEDPTFPGTHTDTRMVTGGILTLDLDTGGLYVPTGFYEFDQQVDLGAVYTSRIQAVIAASGNNIGDTMDTWTSLDTVEALDTSDPSSWSVLPVYAWTNDAAGSGEVWSEWIPFSITDATGMRLKFGLYLYGSTDGRISPAVTQLGVVVDMPDRHLGFKNQQTGVAAGGLTLLFDPPFKHITDATVLFHDLNTTAGEKYEIVARDESHVVVRAKNSAGTVIDRKFDLHAYGYGLVIPTVT